MISSRLSLASSWPATSLKVTPVCFSIYILALLLPKPPIAPSEDIRLVSIRMKKNSTAMEMP